MIHELALPWPDRGITPADDVCCSTGNSMAGTNISEVDNPVALCLFW